MILTPIADDRLPSLIESLAACLDERWMGAVLRRIAGNGKGARAAGAEAAAHHGDALRILARLGMAVRAGSPAQGFSWDGQAARAGTEAYVLLHEAAHFQLAPPSRRRRIDFGLGPGPETGRREEAAQEAEVFGIAREREEAMASLLGILWEVEMGHPALASFLDQNWLEGATRPVAAAHFCHVLGGLHGEGFVTLSGRPTGKLRP